MKPLVLDLNDLTQDMIDRAMPNLEACTYSSPCILGAMMPAEFVEQLKQTPSIGAAPSMDHETIGMVIDKGLVQFVNQEQADTAAEIQEAFDNGNLDDLRRLLPQFTI